MRPAPLAPKARAAAEIERAEAAGGGERHAREGSKLSSALSSVMRPAPLQPRARAAAEIERELMLQAEASDTPVRAVS